MAQVAFKGYKIFTGINILSKSATLLVYLRNKNTKRVNDYKHF